MLSFNETEKLVQQLPIAYYLKRKLNVRLDYSQSSYIDIFKDELVVSYNQLCNVKDFDESDIRCMLYHEVSHALLTPMQLKTTDIINIFEDQRIESICKGYYLDVDFESFVKKVNNYTGQPATSARQCFYQIVRFGVGKTSFVNKAKELIKKFAFLNRSAKWWHVDDYKRAIESFYEEVKQWWESQQNDNSSQTSRQASDNSTQQTDQSSTESKNEESNDSNNEESDNEEFNNSDTESDSKESDEFDDSLGKALESSLESLKKQFDDMVDQSIQESFKELLFKKTTSAKMNGSAINGYSGIFDIRSVGREDYKFFVQKNRSGNVRRFSKIKLNLFIDSSGSFKDSEDIVNKLIYNLQILERQTSDFSFDVVSMSSTEVLLSKTDRRIRCCGYNYLSKKIFDLYDSLQDSQSMNINIVLFDGKATSGCYTKYEADKSAECFKAFNHRNCIIISDLENQTYIKKFCPVASSTIISSGYASLLVKTVIANLKQSLK